MSYLPKDNTPKSNKRCKCCGERLTISNGNLQYKLLKCTNTNYNGKFCDMYCTPQGYVKKDISDLLDSIIRNYYKLER